MTVYGTDQNGFNAIYSTFGNAGALAKIVDPQTPFPGVAGKTFEWFSFLTHTDASGVYVNGGTSLSGGAFVQGIYRWDGTTFSTVVDTATAVPAVPGVPGVPGSTFSQVGAGTVRGGVVPFGASYGLNSGVYLRDMSGAITTIARTGDAFPGGTGGQPILAFAGDVQYDGSKVGFVAMAGTGSQARMGIMLATPGQAPTLAVDFAAPMPDVGVVNQLGGDFALHDGELAFYGGREDVEGIFRRTAGGVLEKVVDTTMTAPGSTSEFRGLSTYVGLDDGNVLFAASTADNGDGGRGMYRSFNGAVAKIVAPGDQINGKTVFDVYFTPDAIDGDTAAFTVRFTDESFVAYTAPVVRGSDQVVPLQATSTTGTLAVFDEASTGAWVDAPAAEQVSFSIAPGTPAAGLRSFAMSSLTAAVGETLITLAELPIGYGDSFQVLVGGTTFGTFAAGETVDFTTLPGGGVAGFTIDGVDMGAKFVGAYGLPVRLEFSAGTADVVAAVAVPEPGALAVSGLLASAGTLARRRRR